MRPLKPRICGPPATPARLSLACRTRHSLADCRVAVMSSLDATMQLTRGRLPHTVLLLLGLAASALTAVQPTIPLYIGGFFPMTNNGQWRGGEETLPGVQIALDLINNSTEILPGYELRLLWNDTQVSTSRQLRAFKIDFGSNYFGEVGLYIVHSIQLRVHIYILSVRVIL